MTTANRGKIEKVKGDKKKQNRWQFGRKFAKTNSFGGKVAESVFNNNSQHKL